MKPQHTPGPWQIGGFGKIYSPGRRPSVDGSLPTAYEIANVPFKSIDVLGVREGESKANAALIAAAPELLEALKNLHKVVCNSDLAFHAANVLAGLIIAKAEGGK